MGPLLIRVQQHTGCSILVVEHDMPLLTAICDRMIALELGQVIAEGTPAEVLEHPAVIESYLGTDESTINRSGRAGVSAPRLRRPVGDRDKSRAVDVPVSGQCDPRFGAVREEFTRNFTERGEVGAAVCVSSTA